MTEGFQRAWLEAIQGVKCDGMRNPRLSEILKIQSTNVGAGLPAIAVDQLKMCQLADRYRRQASSHIF